MFVNVSPLADHYSETVCSLRFATKVSNSPLQYPSILDALPGQQHNHWHCPEAAGAIVIIGQGCLCCILYRCRPFHIFMTIDRMGRGRSLSKSRRPCLSFGELLPLDDIPLAAWKSQTT